MFAARLEMDVPDELAERAQQAGLDVCALIRSAMSAELNRRDVDEWLDTLPTAEGTVTHAEAIAALGAVREDESSLPDLESELDDVEDEVEDEP